MNSRPNKAVGLLPSIGRRQGARQDEIAARLRSPTPAGAGGTGVAGRVRVTGRRRTAQDHRAGPVPERARLPVPGSWVSRRIAAVRHDVTVISPEQGGDARLAELAANLAAVRARIDAACADAGRPASQVHLIAITKTFPAADVLLLHRLGLTEFGE